MYKYAIIPALVILSIIIISNPIAEAVNEKVIIDYSQKIVWEFEDSSGDIEDKKNKFDNEMKQEIKKSTDEFKKDWQTLDIKMKSKDRAIYILCERLQGENDHICVPNSGNTMYQVYPDILFTGTTKNPMSEAEFNILFDAMLSTMRIDMVNYFASEGYTNVKTHIHYSTGSVDYNEGF